MVLRLLTLSIGLCAFPVYAQTVSRKAPPTPQFENLSKGKSPVAAAATAKSPVAKSPVAKSKSVPPEAMSSERTWTDATGKRHTRATLIAVDGSRARFKRPNGMTATMSIAKLSAADQMHIAAWQVAKAKPTLEDFGENLAEALTALPKKSTEFAQAAIQSEGANPLAKLIDAAAFNAAMLNAGEPSPANVVYVRVSQDFLQRQMTREIIRETPVAENILGTDTRGSAHIIGRPKLQFIEHRDGGRANLFYSGHVHSRTVGYNGPVIIHSHGVTSFSAAAQLAITPDRLTATPVNTRAVTRSTIDNITSTLPRLRGRIAVAIAWRRAADQLPIAEEIAANRAATKISREFDAIVASKVKNISKFAADQFAAARSQLNGATPALRYSTTNDYLQVVAIAPKSKAWASEPPRLASRPDVEVHIHRGTVNTALAAMRSPPRSNTVPSAKTNPANTFLRDLLTQWAVTTASPNATSTAAEVLRETPRIDVNWSADNHWLTLAWNGPRRAQENRQPSPSQQQPSQIAIQRSQPQPTTRPRHNGVTTAKKIPTLPSLAR